MFIHLINIYLLFYFIQVGKTFKKLVESLSHSICSHIHIFISKSYNKLYVFDFWEYLIMKEPIRNDSEASKRIQISWAVNKIHFDFLVCWSIVEEIRNLCLGLALFISYSSILVFRIPIFKQVHNTFLIIVASLKSLFS